MGGRKRVAQDTESLGAGLACFLHRAMISTSEHLVQKWEAIQPEKGGFKVTEGDLRTTYHLLTSAHYSSLPRGGV